MTRSVRLRKSVGMARVTRRGRTLLAAALALLLGNCGKDAVSDAQMGVACDPCGQGVPLVQLIQGGVPSSCGSGLTCVAATFSLPGPGVCVRTSGSTTCQGTITDSTGTRHNQCTYTPTASGFDVFCQ